MRGLNELENVIREKAEKQEFSGVVLIMQRGKEIFSGCYGYADKSWKVPNTIETRFRIASISKMFTAVAILQLIEEGKIDFDTKVTEYLELSNTKIPKEVDVESLLTHTSGIGDYYDESLGDEEWERIWSRIPIYKIRTNSDYLSLFKDKDPINEVGKKYHYNGAGYILLGLIIEKASGVSYFDYVRKNVFNKIGMKDSDFLSIDKVYERVAEGYEAIRNSDGEIIEWSKNIYTTTPDAASDGGATSTAHDLIKFIKALRNNNLLGERLSKEMFIPKVIDEEANGARGYAWMYGYGNSFVLNQENNIVRCGHTGEEYGVSARLYYYPELETDVIILANQGMCAGALGWDIHNMLLQ
ncbi:serine hydrolase [Clostridium sp. YIM B02551]|uniref:serine hydrolase domain-containing protein n=1 Tax=Clostridium sp. YIM B02551 TaxID=2910679 RepID=UPI001EEC9FDF|nr:serine hydrolase [Clostridium sp. YIM B02551]